MIPAATQTLAEFLAQGLARISQGDISFEHPQIVQVHRPSLNLYCYHIQANPRADLSRGRLSLGVKENGEWLQSGCQWFDLTFLVSALDHTSLGEQNLLASVLTMLTGYDVLPEAHLAPALRGWGALPMRISTQAVMDNLKLWGGLHAPLRLALHVTLTVPCQSAVPQSRANA